MKRSRPRTFEEVVAAIDAISRQVEFALFLDYQLDLEALSA